MRVLGTDFYWNTLVEKDGKLYRIVQDPVTKLNHWELIKDAS